MRGSLFQVELPPKYFHLCYRQNIMTKIVRKRSSMGSLHSIRSIPTKKSKSTLSSGTSTPPLKHKGRRRTNIFAPRKFSSKITMAKKIKRKETTFKIPKLVLTTNQNEKIELKEESPQIVEKSSPNHSTKLLFKRLKSSFSKSKDKRRKIRPQTSQPRLYKSRNLRLKAPKLDHIQKKYKRMYHSQKSHKIFKNR